MKTLFVKPKDVVWHRERSMVDSAIVIQITDLGPTAKLDSTYDQLIIEDSLPSHGRLTFTSTATNNRVFQCKITVSGKLSIYANIHI